MEETIIVNKPRLPVIIGEQGFTKKNIEKKTNTLLEIDSHTAEITITANKSYYEIYLAKKIINAIARGFSPEHAFLLLKDGFVFETLSIQDYVGKNTNRITDIKGRVIGKQGKIKKYIEKRYGCKISVYGKTVGVISTEGNIENILKVIKTILDGSKHKTAFKIMKDQKITKNYTKKEDDKKIDDISFG
jgi:ribosomal RNA assembly protein